MTSMMPFMVAVETPDLTWFLRIVGVEFGSQSHCDGHLDQKHDCVEQRL